VKCDQHECRGHEHRGGAPLGVSLPVRDDTFQGGRPLQEQQAHPCIERSRERARVDRMQ
jgi:hypothetical protein